MSSRVPGSFLYDAFAVRVEEGMGTVGVSEERDLYEVSCEA